MRFDATQSFAPMAVPVLIVVTIATDSGNIKSMPEMFKVIEWAETTIGPKGLNIKAANEKQPTSIVELSAKGIPNFRKLFIKLRSRLNHCLNSLTSLNRG